MQTPAPEKMHEKKKSGKIEREKERKGGMIVKYIPPLIAAGNNTLIGL